MIKMSATTPNITSNDKCSATPSRRISWIDDAKMFAMLSVIAFHAIGYMSEKLAGRNDALNFIGTYNMQLFMFLAGYTSMKSLEKVTNWNTYWHYVVKIALHLMLPTFAIGILRALLTLDPAAIGNEQWFLKMLFRYLLVFATVNLVFSATGRMVKGNYLKGIINISRYAVFFLLMFVITKSKPSEFATFFLAAYLLRKHDVLEHISGSLPKATKTILAAAMFAIGLATVWSTYGVSSAHSFYGESFYVLMQNRQADIFLCRQLCGMGWVTIFTLIFILMSRHYTRFSLWGSKSLGLYIIHTFFMRLTLDRITFTCEDTLIGWSLIAGIVTAYTALSLITISLLEKNRFTNFLFLGAGLSTLKNNTNRTDNNKQ